MALTSIKPGETKLLIQIVDGARMDVTVKGNRHEVIAMIVDAMERQPEAREAILHGAKEFLSKNKFNFHK
jgi:hypothetical protein